MRDIFSSLESTLANASVPPSVSQHALTSFHSLKSHDPLSITGGLMTGSMETQRQYVTVAETKKQKTMVATSRGDKKELCNVDGTLPALIQD